MRTSLNPIAPARDRALPIPAAILLAGALLAGVFPFLEGAQAVPSACTSFVSDANTLADGHHHAFAMDWGFGDWATIPSGPAGQPKYLWSTWDSTNPMSATFTRSTPNCQGGEQGRLYVNADDSYYAYWNGELVSSCTSHSMACFTTYHQAPLAFKPGMNTLSVVGINNPCECENPAMVQFRVDVLSPGSGSPQCSGFVSDSEAWADYPGWYGNAAVGSTIRSWDWAPIPPGANGQPQFIWATTDPIAPMQATFTRQVSGCTAGATGILSVNGDDSYRAYWNGALVASCTSTTMACFTSYRQVPITFQAGTNTLVVEGINNPCSDCDPNPAMVQFRVDLVSNPSCDDFVSDETAWATHAAAPLGNPAIAVGQDGRTPIPAGPAGAPKPIWATAYGPSTPSQATFTRQVEGCSAEQAGKPGVLYVNADDAYEAYWNGDLVASCVGTDSSACDSGYQVALLAVRPGANTLTVVGHNGCSWWCKPMVQFRVDLEPTACAEGRCENGGSLGDLAFDTDRDGYSNLYELQHNSDPTDVQSTPEEDDDCDDKPNEEEWDFLAAKGIPHPVLFVEGGNWVEVDPETGQFSIDPPAVSSDQEDFSQC